MLETVLIIKNVALLVLIIFSAAQIRFFNQLFLPTRGTQSKPYLVIFFGCLGLLGRFLTSPLGGQEIVSLDFFPVIIGGLAAGPLVGLGAGLIAAIPDWLTPGYLALTEGLILTLGGVLSGLLAPRREVWATLAGSISRISNLVAPQLVNGEAKYFNKCAIYVLVTSVTLGLRLSLLPILYGIPLSLTLPGYFLESTIIFLSSMLGVVLAMRVLDNLLNEEEFIIAHQAQKTLRIADETLPHLRGGLTSESAATTAHVILTIANASAVAITDKKNILAYEGLGADHHRVGGVLLTRSTKEVLTTGALKVITDRSEIGCPFPGCPLKSAIIIPLKSREKVIGTLKLYLGESGLLTPHFISLAAGLGDILSIQIELAEIARLEQLNTQAELKALQAQINPHFLFNTLNTIASFYRTKPEVARELLVKFADFFRRSFNQPKEFVSLEEELEYIDAYLLFEKARFGEKLVIEKRIEEEALLSLMPPLVLQPIVENAVKHGMSAKNDTSNILIRAKRVNDELELLVKDDGLGINPGELEKIFTIGYGRGNGVGMNNVNERLKAIYGERFTVKIFSRPNKGTTVSMRIPQRLH